MINLKYANKYCKDNIKDIENYDLAVKDSKMWDCHHRLEIDLNMTHYELKRNNLYYNRPANELIFLTRKEHLRLHYVGKPGANLGRKFSEEWCKKISEARKNIKLSEEHKLAISKKLKGRKPWNTGTHYINPDLKGIVKGTIWINNGITNKRIKPSEFETYKKIGFVEGRLWQIHQF